MATVTPASAAGVVQFFNGMTLLGDVTVASGTASLVTPVSANYSYTADFVPNLGDETGAGTSAATIVGGSASNTVASSSAVTVTGFSPTRLGRGASNVGVTLTGTGFANGAICQRGSSQFPIGERCQPDHHDCQRQGRLGSAAGGRDRHRHRLGGLCYVHHLRDTDAGLHLLQHERLADDLQDVQRDRFGVRFVGVHQYDRQFITAQAEDRTGRRDDRTGGRGPSCRSNSSPAG